MAHRRGNLRTRIQAQREAERQLRLQTLLQTRAARAAAQAQKAYEHAQHADQKERARLYTESRIAHISLLNEQLDRDVTRLSNLLSEAILIDSFINLQTQKQVQGRLVFNPGHFGVAERPPILSMPPDLRGIQKFIPGAKEKHAQEIAKAQEFYQVHVAAHTAREAARQRSLAEARAVFERQVAEAHQRVEAQNAEIDNFQRELTAGSPAAIVDYFTMVLASSNYPHGFPQHAKLAYVPESKQLVIEYDLPSFEVIPEIGSYKYMKTKDEVTQTVRPLAQRKTLYSSVVAQVTLRSLHELFKSDRMGHVDIIVFNGYVASIDKGTGRPIRPCLITVRTSRDTFTQLNLSKVDPLACLNVLNASISKSPTELAPVRPVLEFNMVDPRFIEETDVLSGLDQRPNLMDLTPLEFESLISNLFQKMGLETRLTQASRDGGVDCVAYDPRPIFGGKVVIQAKRYKHTVGVNAVRDLFGTMQNEGASKGILVTTSGYGKATFEFAEGKPLELLSGSHLLYLLAEHAGIEARIEIPDDWKDPQPDSPAE
jgi:restriction system protein